MNPGVDEVFRSARSALLQKILTPDKKPRRWPGFLFKRKTMLAYLFVVKSRIGLVAAVVDVMVISPRAPIV